MKTALVGDWLVLGSTNFTTSSRSNHELSVLLWLDADSKRHYNKLYEELMSMGEPLTNDIIANAEADAERKRREKEEEKKRSGQKKASSKSSASSSKH